MKNLKEKLNSMTFVQKKGDMRMKKSFSRVLCLLIVFSFVLQSSMVHAATASVAPTASEVTITNNVGKADTIYITGVMAGDVISVYNAATGGKIIGKTNVKSNKTDATISIAQIGASGGSVYIAVTSKGMTESSRTEVAYEAEATSEPPIVDNITITNNVGKSDTINVAGLAPGDVIKVYTAANGGKLLGSATVSSSRTDVTKSFSQLGTKEGTLYVSVTSKGMHESERVPATFSAENQSDAPKGKSVTIKNNVGKADTICVGGLAPGDVVKVYTADTTAKLLGTATVGSQKTEATITISQLGVDAGTVYISVQSKGMLESSKASVIFPAEGQSDSATTGNITVTNNAGKADIVQVSGLSEGDKIIVYNAANGGKVLGSATVPASESNATVSISQLGTQAGSIYVSIINSGMLESSRVRVTYPAESVSGGIDKESIVINNNSGKPDTITLTGLLPNEVVKVYDLAKDGNLLGSAKVAANDTKVVISITQLGTSSGSVYISRSSSNKVESDRVKVDYLEEQSSDNPKAENIVVTNNAGSADTVQVNGISAGDVVNVYDSAKGGNLLGTAAVEGTGMQATVSIPQLGTNGGSVYISIVNSNKCESSRTQVAFQPEFKSTAPSANKITIVNNVGIASTVTVNGLTGYDVVNVYNYDQGGTLLGSATVGQYDTGATVSVAQLGENAGSVFVSVISKGKLESDRTKAEYSPKSVSSAPNADNITVENNSGVSDTVEVSGIQPNDIVNVYDSLQGGNLLGTATVSSINKATVTIPQLGTSEGKIYVSVKSTGKIESTRTLVAYSAEAQSDALDSRDIFIKNNSGTPDIIEVTSVAANDIVKVYNASQGGTLLGSAKVGSSDSKAIVTVAQLGTNAGSVYISVTRLGKTESIRTKADYLSESIAPVIGNICVQNNAVISDTVTVKGLTANDIIKVYDAEQNGNLLGYAIVPANSQEVTVTIPQLTSAPGSVYVSVTNFGRLESKRTKADYLAEQTSGALYPGNISILNNIGTADVIKVMNLSSSDVIKVYDAATGGNLIGITTVPANSTQASINISQLGTAAGSVYISVTNLGKIESSRTKVEYTAEK